MAQNIIPQPKEISFTAASNVYRFDPAVTVLDLEDQLRAKQVHLSAMLSVASEAGSTIEIPNYFWACRATAEEIEDLTAELLLRLKGQPHQ